MSSGMKPWKYSKVVRSNFAGRTGSGALTNYFWSTLVRDEGSGSQSWLKLSGQGQKKQFIKLKVFAFLQHLGRATTFFFLYKDFRTLLKRQISTFILLLVFWYCISKCQGPITGNNILYYYFFNHSHLDPEL